MLRGAAIDRVRRVRLAALLMFPLAFLAAVMLRINGAGLASMVGVVSFIYLLSLFGTGFQLFRSSNGRPEPDRLLKTFAGIHLVLLCVFAPLWLGVEDGNSLARPAILTAPIAVYAIWGVLRLGRRARGQDRLVEVIETFVPQRMARLVVAELRILVLALFAWGAWRPHEGQPGFTSGAILAPVLISVALLSIAEITIVHLIIGHWSQTGAYILTAIGLFVCTYMVGLAKSLRYMPTVLMPHSLLVRLGHFHAVEIPYEAIETVRKVAAGAPVPPKSFNLAAMSAPNLLIELSAERETIGIGGRKRVFRKIAVRMDDAVGFEACLCGRLKKSRAGEPPIGDDLVATNAVRD